MAKKQIRLDQFKDFKFLSSMKSNRRHKKAVFAVSEVDVEKNKYPTKLWLLNNNKTRQLTDLGEETGFVWDTNQSILFPAERTQEEKEPALKDKGKTHYYRLNLKGGEAQKAFTLPLKVQGIWPLKKSRYLVMAGVDQAMPDLYKCHVSKREEYFKDKKKFDFRHKITRIPFYFNGHGFLGQMTSGLFLYDEKKDKFLRLTDAKLDIGSVYLQDDHDAIYFAASEVSPKNMPYAKLYKVSKRELERAALKEEVLTALYTEAYGKLDYSISYVFQGKDKVFVAASDMKTFGLNESAKFYILEDGKLQLHLDEELTLWNSVGSDAALYGSPTMTIYEDDLYWVGTKNHSNVIYKLDRNGEFSTYYESEGRIDGIIFLDDVMYLIGMFEQNLQEIYSLKDDKLRKVSEFNKTALRGYNVAKPVRMTLDTDPEIEGWVLLPHDFDPDEKYPAILDVHGGPRTVYGEVFFHEMQYWVSQGYIVFFCNPRGSDGRGDSFADIRGKYGTIDYEDIMAFTDKVLEKYPQIDPKRVGVTGGSYGGFMTNWIITHTDRFKAAATQRSISNWISFYGTSDISYTFACDQNATDTLSEKGFMKLWEHSPIRYINNAKTPTLIIHSDQDYRCPEEQAFQLFTALLDRGIPSEMYLFKGENHELSRSGRPQGRIERLRRITEWMDRYLKEEE